MGLIYSVKGPNRTKPRNSSFLSGSDMKYESFPTFSLKLKHQPSLDFKSASLQAETIPLSFLTAGLGPCQHPYSSKPIVTSLSLSQKFTEFRSVPFWLHLLARFLWRTLIGAIINILILTRIFIL